MNEKTVVIWNTFEAEATFFLLDGDQRKFDGVYIGGAGTNEIQEELAGVIYDEDGFPKPQIHRVFPIEAVKAGAFVISAGIVP